MAVVDLFSRRKRIADGKTPDVYQYDELPQSLRVQIVQIMRDAVGEYHQYGKTYNDYTAKENNEGWKIIHDSVAHEHGVFKLAEGSNPFHSCKIFLLNSHSVDLVLDLIEFGFWYIHSETRQFGVHERAKRGICETADEAIKELNERFKQAGVGYQFEDGYMLRIDSELIHSDIVKPALRYLNEDGFEGPRDEFMSAHAHYRNGEMKDAIIDANNAFESTLKSICVQRGWEYQKGDSASRLIKVVRDQGLLPDYLDNSFDQLVATLKSGLPKIRGEEGSHGQGANPRKTPDYVAAYALHLAAAQILFLAKAHNASSH